MSFSHTPFITPHRANRARHNRKINTSSSMVEEKEILTKHLTEPPVKRIDLMTSLGMKITARSMKGVTIKDALDAIHKANKKRVSASIHMETQLHPCARGIIPLHKVLTVSRTERR